MNKLIEKEKVKPELSSGAKSYCQQWLKEQIYGRRYEVKSKYLEKGNLCEDYAIEMLNYIFKKQYVKNEQYFENEYMTGTPDIIDTMIRDIKTVGLLTVTLFLILKSRMNITGKCKAI